MSDITDNQGPQPRTRREILEDQQCERGVWGGREVHATASEPLPDIQETGYQGVMVRETPTHGVEIKHRGLVIGAFTMVFMSTLLFFAPFLNSLMAGAFGGFFAKRWGRAFGAAAIASVAVPAIFAFFYGFFDTPDFYNLFYGLGFGGWTALHVVGLLIGTASGVYSRPLAERRGLRREVTVL
ncbi:hypothetical protein [Archangium sp.]|jgi:hypothetical protein|uniref:hypothetical protein n=1 Tax=Archangium sp. TaxID=1872627 RepID=UPI002EDB43C1